MKTDLRSWLTDVEAHGELKTVDGADWNKEIGTVVELMPRRAARRCCSTR